MRIGGAGVCRTDLHIIEGQWAEKSGVNLPYTLGHENAGWVAGGRRAPSPTSCVGDTVILHPLVTCGLCRACRAGDDVHCENSAFPGIDTDGGYAEYLRTTRPLASSSWTTPCEPADVAALADAGLTAYHAVAKAARALRPGDRCRRDRRRRPRAHRHPGAARLTPAEIDRRRPSPDALDLAVGARRRPHGRRRRLPGRAVLELTGGNGAEAVIDFVGEGGAIEDGVAMLRRAGNYYVIGYGGELNVPTIDIISTEINFIGNLVGSYNDLAELMVLAAQRQGRAAHRDLPPGRLRAGPRRPRRGSVRGRAILIPNNLRRGDHGQGTAIQH